jgi:predicted metal-dependent phosphoesterase TrpH
MRADLHIHTNASDGMLSPSNVVDYSVEKKLRAIAVTDHDTVSGLSEAIARSKIYNNFTVINGIELSCSYLNEEVHILGYFIDPESPVLIKALKNFKEDRFNRTMKIIKKLNKLNIEINMDDVRKYSSGEIFGRPHIARALVYNGYVSDISEAFNLYLGNGKPAYVERNKLSITDGIDLIHKANGIAVLAHPGILDNKDAIFYAIEKGIDGIEVIHSKHSQWDVLNLLKIANENNLIVSGGSDWHGDTKNNNIILGEYYVNYYNFINSFKKGDFIW